MAFVSRSFDTGNRKSRRSILCRLVDKAIPAMPAGQLCLVLPNGETIERHGEAPGPDATMVVQRWRALRSMLVYGEYGFADGYLDGEWTTPDLAQLLEFCARNESALAAKADSASFGLIS